MAKSKTTGRPRRAARKGKRRMKQTRIRVADIATGAMLLDGLVGLDNIANLNFRAAWTELQKSVSDPLAPGGLVDDCVDAAVAYGVIEGVDRIATAVSGKKPGMTLGRFRITIG